ncbi:hypothetical protein M426DRAFT_324162 [Hypoxylon sp. CI-4A]|nr:hypothetical protein M426DRAFT_324162 [Hypoxylon sp. CI-4A]
MMSDRTAENILARRRVQNREAQRRFREKKILQKTIDLPQYNSHSYRTPHNLNQLSPPADPFRSFSPQSSPERSTTADILRNTESWDLATPIPLGTDDSTLFEYNNLSDDATSHLPIFLPRESSTATFGPADTSRRLSMLDSPVATSMDRLLSITETSLSPQNASSSPYGCEKRFQSHHPDASTAQ